MFLREYEVLALRSVWESQDPVHSKTVWEEVNSGLGGETISRASIINFLSKMQEEGVLDGREERCRGGRRVMYSPLMDEGQFRRHLASTMISSLIDSFRDETLNAIKKTVDKET